MGNLNKLERYAFISIEMWKLVSDIFPDAVTYGNSKVIQYASNEDGTLSDEATMLLSKVNQYGFDIVMHDKVSVDMIVNAINSGIDKVYSCNHDVALHVAAHFSTKGS